MRKNKRVLKALSVLAAGGLVLEEGCLWNLPENVWKGFGYGIGAIPADVIGTLIVVPLLEGFLPADDTAA